MPRIILLVAVITACARVLPSSSTPAAPAPSLLPVPLVEGPLAPRVVYPRANAVIASRDSNFIFGSVGNGRASLTVNGSPVHVLRNGSWIAFLSNPRGAAPAYDLVVVLGTDTARLSHPIRLLSPRSALNESGPLTADSASITPRGTLQLRPEELVTVSIRAPRNASVWLTSANDERWPLLNGGELDNEAQNAADARPLSRYLNSPNYWSLAVPARFLVPVGTPRIVVARGQDTLEFGLAAIDTVAHDRVSLALLAPSAAASDTDQVIMGRAIPAGTYKWFLLPGTRLRLTGRNGEFARLQLDDALEAWVSTADIVLLPEGMAPPRRVASNARVLPQPEWVDIIIPTGERPAYLVEESERSLTLTLYGTQATTDIIRYPSGDSLVRLVTWEPVSSSRVTYTVHLSQKPFGYLVMWRDGNLVFRVRRPPRVDLSRPLRGLTIAVDPGHPPIGATGPTGLYEAEATLAISLRLRTLLEERGASVVMTRTTSAPVALSDRPIMARRANAHALVSIHLNALPDGVNPFNAHGTGTYFFHPQSAPLALSVQRGMVATMGLRDLGIYYDNLALVRPTWMPAVLCEGAFIMIPEQEAALRTPQFQDAYARGVAQGLEAFFRGLEQPR
ncbi:MAG: N-acetylmuramoyl-L-alanine amidase [Anaerolineae bacterium]|nr:N-acetylmuramoyl-L-alanine amidase [Gemmatimonadaceae bacterium]